MCDFALIGYRWCVGLGFNGVGLFICTVTFNGDEVRLARCHAIGVVNFGRYLSSKIWVELDTSFVLYIDTRWAMGDFGGSFWDRRVLILAMGASERYQGFVKLFDWEG